MMKARPIPIKTSVSHVSPYPSPTSPTTMFSPSQCIANYPLSCEFLSKYNLGIELGFGGFGFVYSATRISDGVEVACKFIFKSKIVRSSWTFDRELGRCPMEVAVLKNVKHENIIQFVEYMEDSIFCYCITELHGTAWSDEQTETGHKRSAMDLFECIEKFESFTEPAARHIFTQIVDAVSHLHDIGLVHRDIKDENILIDDKFHVKLIDFGSASFFDPTGHRKFDMFLGTKQYAAPEILMQREYRGPEAEVWALGCCLYIILTGAVPFSSQSQATDLPFTRPNRPLCTSCLNLLNKMLEKSPDYRATLKEIKSHPWLTMNSYL